MAAGRLGVRAGMRISEARAHCAALDVRVWDDQAITDAVLAGTAMLLTASPQVTPVIGTPGMWWIGATGFDALGGEDAFAHALLQIALQWHPQARVAIADSCVAARAATWAPIARGTTSAASMQTPRTGRQRRTPGWETTPATLRAGTQLIIGATPRNDMPDTPGTPDVSPQITCIPSGRCAHYLAPAPLGLVPMPSELREALQALGLRTVGALAALTASDVEDRWGHEGLGAWRLAHGDDPRRPGLTRVEMARSATVELPSAVERAEPVLFVVRAQLQRLVQDCVRDGRAAAAVSITLVLDAGRQYPIEEIGSEWTDDIASTRQVQEPLPESGESWSGSKTSDLSARPLHADASSDDLVHMPTILNIPQRTITREVRPARPLARLDPLFDQCRMLLERWTIPAPIIGVTIGIPATAPLAADQGDLLIPSWRDAAMNAEAVFARLRAVLDPERRGDVVVHPRARDTHRVEEAGFWAPADAVVQASAPLPALQSVQVPQSTATTPAVLRLLETPEAVRVAAPHGAPGMLWWRGRRITFRTAIGPERLSGDWWRGDKYARDYWRCHADTDGELLLYCEGGVHWHVHGWYD
ncbi:MAG TPA: hypothetical protein VGE27_04870 [Gemmatimonas sp.]|uniref:hypothetical protein n=1 Tax=Gemmatimonas sp. TaxID=1962908 RepID=UPI002ED89DF7